MKKIMIGIIAVAAIAGLTAGCHNAQQTPAESTNTAGQETQTMETTEGSGESSVTNQGNSAWDVETDLDQGVYTIRIKAKGQEKKDYWWQNYTGDMGDATATELVGDYSDKEGIAYSGSFKAMDGIDYPTESTIRLIYTDGLSSAESMDFTMKIENGEITECIGGSQSFPVKDEDLEPILSGSWKDEAGGKTVLKLTRNPEEGFDGVLVDAKGKEFTFNARYDCIQEAFLYHNGTDDGYGLVAVDPETQDTDHVKLFLHDLAHTDGEDLTLVKAD